MRSSCGIILALLCVCLASPPARAMESLERGLLLQAPDLVKYLQEKKFKNVGVLKFLVVRQGKLSDNVGTLNMLLARRLEMSLLLGMKPPAPFGVVRNASAVAARTKGANHLTKAGKEKLFAADYPLAWGKDEVKVDAFITGVAGVSDDLQSLRIRLFLITKDDPKPIQIGKDLVVKNDPAKMSEMGESFTLRGWPTPFKMAKEAAENAVSVKKDEAKHPLTEAKPPVKLEVRYGNVPQKIEYREGKAFLPEPKEGTTVTFHLIRDDSKARYGVVLKVNGENTLLKQKEPDFACRRWVLEPGRGPAVISGYQLTTDELAPFKVLSHKESVAKEMSYGDDVGMITMTVWREAKGDEEPSEDKLAKRVAVIEQTAYPEKKEKPENFDALIAQMLDEPDRGLIGSGPTVKGKVTRVKFKADRTPVMSAAIIYYKKK